MNESLNEWEKFSLLIWKNWRSYWNHRNHFIWAILAPMLFTSVLIVIRFNVSVLSFETARYKSIDIDYAFDKTIKKLINDTINIQTYSSDFEYNQFLPKITIGYAPNNESVVEDIMNLVAEKIPQVPLVGYKTASKLHKAMIEDRYFAGVDLTENTDLFNRPARSKDSTDFTISLIFPSELRYYDDTFIGSDWATDSNYDIFSGHEQRFPYDNNGGYVGYVREGFIMLQNVVSLAFIKHFASKEFPTIYLQRFPYHAHKQDQLTESMDVYLAFVILTGFLYPCMFITWVLSKERENTMKEVIKIYGTNYFIQFCAWFVFAMIIFFSGNILLATVLKIQWTDGYGITTNCSWFALVIFLTAYSTASIAFCFMVNSFCKKTQSAIIWLALLWIATFLPLIVKMNQNIQDTVLFWIIMHFFSNNAMGLAFLKILEYEQYAQGFTLKNFFVSQNYDDKITVGITTLIFLGQCILYVLIGIYVDKINPGSYGIASSWNYLFTKPDTRRLSEKRRSSPMRQTKVFEVEPQYKKINVQIEKLCKAYKSEFVINDIQMNFFENEIIVFMGHNGCGKTTLLMMIVGLLKPTSGAIAIYGFDVDKNREIAQSFLGICLQQNMVLPDLSVSEQLRFYCRLKGMKNNTEIENEIVYYLRAVDLFEYYHVFTRQLSAGNTRLLSICCALCARSQVVVLDMASVGMDLDTKKLLWKLLTTEKKYRTIVLTTHCPFEAEALADRIGMISGGELKCMGTTHFLKNMYGIGYRLVCTKGENCDAFLVTRTIQQIVPDVKPESNIGIELSYRLKHENSQTFAQILTLLEEKAEDLYLHGFYITNTTIEDIYLAMGSNDPSEGEIERHKEIMNGIAPFNNYDNLDFLKPYKPYEGCQLFCHHLKALLHQRFTYIFRTGMFWLEMMLLPTMVIALAFFVSQHNFEAPNLPEMVYRFSQYSDTVTPIKVLKPDDRSLSLVQMKYLRAVAWMGLNHKTVTVEDKSMEEFILEMQANEVEHAYKKYLIGATLGPQGYIAWFNNFAIHSAPLSLNVLHNALLQTYSEHSSITVKLTPLPFASAHYHPADMSISSSTGNFLSSTLSYCVVFVYTFSIMYIVKERQTRFKLIQNISGLKPLTYWFTCYAYDLIIVATFSAMVLAVIWIFQLTNVIHYKLANSIAALIFVFGVAIMPFVYVMSQLNDNYVLSYFVSCIFCIFGDVALAAVVDAIEEDDGKVHLSSQIEWIFRIHPYFSLSRAFYKIFNIEKHSHLCSNEIVKSLTIGLKKCSVRPNCCIEFKVMDWGNNGILPEVLSFFLVGVICVIIIIIKECWYLRTSSKDTDLEAGSEPSKQSSKSDTSLGSRHLSLNDIILEKRRQSSQTLDFDRDKCVEAVNEKFHVNTLKENELEDKPLVLNQFTKRYGDVIAADRLYLIVDRKESVGLVGKHGTGKTTIIKVLTGEEKITSGKAFVEGISVTHNLYEMYKHIGYCPEECQFLDHLTVYEVMKFMCMLNGMPNKHIEQRCETLAKVLGFYEDFDKRCNLVSYGNIRRLSTAISFLGNPTIIYLDEPFKCIDPAGIRLQWNILNIVRKAGKSLLIASNRPRECAMVCTRFVVISNGSFHWLGTVHKLQRLQPLHYLLRVKIKSFADHLEVTKLKPRKSKDLIVTPVKQSTPYSKILLFVETEFPNAFLKEENGLVLYFQIPRGETTISEIFSKIQHGFINLYVEDFTVTNLRLAVSLMDTVDYTFQSHTSNIDLRRKTSKGHA